MEKLKCRICFVENIRIHSIMNTNLQYVYDKFTDNVLAEGAAPLLACYICVARLNNCYQMMLQCRQSEAILTAELKGYRVNGDMKRLTAKTLSISLVNQFSVPEEHQRLATQCKVEVKEETDDSDLTGHMEMKIEIEEHPVPSPKPDSSGVVPCFMKNETQSDSEPVPPDFSEPELLTVFNRKECEEDNVISAADKAEDSDKRRDNANENRVTNTEKFKCDTCQKCFKSNSKLTRHIRIHTGEKPFACDLCDSRFNEKNNLNRHRRTHIGTSVSKPGELNTQQSGTDDATEINYNGSKPFKCDVCRRSFSEKGHLIRHTRVHTGEKPHKCNMCMKSFKQKAHLQRHALLHTGVKPYKCDVCQCTFTQLYNLVKHKRVHTGERPFHCGICQRGFSDNSKLNRHIRTGHVPYECDVCHESFSRKSHLKSHTTALHTVLQQ